MGNEFVGVIKAVGSKVQDFKAGQRVLARNPIDNIGAFAEKIVINQNAVAKVPTYLTDEETATIPLTALTAIQAFEKLDAQDGQTLFISGGSGSFGDMTIPLDVACGLKVITTGNAQSKQRLIKLGVEQFIDYRTEDYQKMIHDVDLVIDTLGGNELQIN